MNGVLSLRTRAAWRRKWPSLLAIAFLIAVSLAVTLTSVSGARRARSAPARFLRDELAPLFERVLTILGEPLDLDRGPEAGFGPR